MELGEKLVMKLRACVTDSLSLTPMRLNQKKPGMSSLGFLISLSGPSGGAST